MKLHRLPAALALAGIFFAPYAGAADPVAEESTRATSVEKKASREEARAAQKASIKAARRTGEFPSTDWTSNQNTQKPVGGTHESRKPAHKAQRDLVKQQARAGELPAPNDEWESSRNAAKKVEGTHEGRKAERKEIRAELTKANKRGEIPMVTEAGLGR